MLVRKLLLRGYKVKALAREHSGAENGKPLPPAVEVVVGDVGDEAACLRAVQGVDKVPGQTHGTLLALTGCVVPYKRTDTDKKVVTVPHRLTT